MKNTLFIPLSALLLAACASTAAKPETAASNSSDQSYKVQKAISAINENTNKIISSIEQDEDESKPQKKYCSEIRRLKIDKIDEDYVIAAECSPLLPDKVCVIPKAQHIYMKKKQLNKIGVKVIYDGLIFELPEKKCLKFTGTHAYKTRLDNVSELLLREKSETVIPIAEIASRH